MSVFASSRCCWVQQRQRSGPSITQRKERKAHLKAPQMWIKPLIAAGTDDSRCNTKISGATANVSTSATHQRDALPVPEIASVHGRIPTHSRRGSAVRRERGSLPKQLGCVRGDEAGRRAKEAREPQCASGASVYSGPSRCAEAPPGGYFRSLSKYRTINYKSRAKASRLTHLCVPVCWWRSCRLVGDGGRWLSVQVERRVLRNRAPASCSHSQIRYRNGRSVRWNHIPSSFSLDDTTEEEQFSLSPPPLSRDAFMCIPENAASLRLAFLSSDDAFCGTLCAMRPRETSRPQICSSFTFKFISVFILKKSYFEIPTKVFTGKSICE